MNVMKQELIRAGLSEKEAAIYLSALKLGSAPVQEIAENASVNRPTAYMVLESLLARGLVSRSLADKRRVFVPESPERMLSILRSERRAIEEREEGVAGILPSLMALYVGLEGDKPRIRYMEGAQGRESVREIFQKKRGEFLQLVPYDVVAGQEAVLEGRDEHMDRLKAERANYRILVSMDHSDPKRLPRLPGGEMRILSSERFPFRAEISIREDTVFFFSYQEHPLSVVMTSQEVADAARVLFELAWQGAQGNKSLLQ